MFSRVNPPPSWCFFVHLFFDALPASAWSAQEHGGDGFCAAFCLVARDLSCVAAEAKEKKSPAASSAFRPILSPLSSVSPCCLESLLRVTAGEVVLGRSLGDVLHCVCACVWHFTPHTGSKRSVTQQQMTASPDYQFRWTLAPGELDNWGGKGNVFSSKYTLLLIPAVILAVCFIIYRSVQMKRRKAANAMNDVNNNRPTDHNGKSEGLSAPPAYPPPAYAPPAHAPGHSPRRSVAGARAPRRRRHRLTSGTIHAGASPRCERPRAAEGVDILVSATFENTIPFPPPFTPSHSFPAKDSRLRCLM